MTIEKNTIGGMGHGETAVIRASLLNRRQRLEELRTRTHAVQVAELLAEVDATLDRLEVGSYGACVGCNGRVEPDRLAADPLATVCLECLSEGERRALERDLELASGVQASLLPPRNLDSPGWVGHYTYRPHLSVSGDYVDLVEEEGCLLLLFGDVSGKGLAAALLMSHLHAVFRATAGTDASLSQVLEQANRLLYGSAPRSSYATLVAARLKPDGTLEMCTAGHVSPILATQEGFRSLSSDGLPLGLFPHTEFPTRRLSLERGDTLVLFTDGLTEGLGINGEEFGVAGVEKALRSHSWSSPADLVSTLIQAAESFRGQGPAQDDLTVLALQRRLP